MGGDVADKDPDEEAARLKRARDYADFQNEMAGRDTGRMQRFTTKDEFQRNAAARTGKDTDRQRADALFAQVAYQEIYERSMRALDLQGRAADLALKDIDREIYENRVQHRKMLDEAYRLRDGRRVFMTEDGTAAYDEHGARLAEPDFATLSKDELRTRGSWQEFSGVNESHDRLRKERESIIRHDQERQQLERRAERRELGADELERETRRLDQAMPERARAHRHRLEAEEPASQRAARPDVVLADAEEKSMAVRRTSAAAKFAETDDFAGAPRVSRSFAGAAASKPVTAEPRPNPVIVPGVSPPGPG